MSRRQDAENRAKVLEDLLESARDDIAALKRDVPAVIWAKMRVWYPSENSLVYDFRAAISSVIREGKLTREEVAAWMLPAEEVSN